ncbi:tetratricopeptide repeat protein [Streptosporangiaceae bacterium NEAU-GS5]|nr:tetratricopeptide repeat protein [Streptosporangiaceae bacterium NEAU-GS5]
MGKSATFGLLGPFELRIGGDEVLVRSAKHRVLLATLSLRNGQHVSFEELAEAVWGDDYPDYPDNPRRAIQIIITRVRSLLIEHGSLPLIVTGPDGYRLDVPPDSVDVGRFAALLREADRAAEAGDLAAESAALGEALAQWRGDPLADVPSGLLHRTYGHSLAEQRMTARERWIGLRLSQGDHAELLGELTTLTSQHPLREKLWQQLITVLHASGRRADALDAYHLIRRRLAEEFGVDPGPELQQLHAAILGGPAEGGPDGLPPVPRQLPTPASGFAGRAEQINALHALLTHRGDDRRGAVVVITGTAGAGKTALALHWARRVAEHFPDGQLWVDLRGYDSRARMFPCQALALFLRALGVPGPQVPRDVEGQLGLYRSLMDGRRMLVVLDNAADDQQALPLLPCGPGNLAVVTSRNELSGLVAAGGHPVRLGTLGDGDARRMLLLRLGTARIQAEPDAVDQIIERCARLPLALAIVAARAATHPTFSLASLAAELDEAHHRLDAFTGSPATDVRSVLAWSYESLTPAAARLFRLLGLHPGPDIAAAAAAGLAGSPVRHTCALLTELARAHLVEEPSPGRYTFHDLLRAYAAELAHTEDGPAERRAAEHRLLDHYLHTAAGAAHALYPHDDEMALDEVRPGVTPERVRGYDQALAWFAAERLNLQSLAVRAADGQGFDAHAWRLAMTLVEFSDRKGYWQDWISTHMVALDAARRAGDRLAQARLRTGLARALNRLGRHADARAQLESALRHFKDLGHPADEAATYLALASAAEREGDLAEAVGHDRAALDLYRTAGQVAGQAEALNALAWDLAHSGDFEHAAAYGQEAIELAEAIGDRHAAAAASDTLGYVGHLAGDHAQAITCFRHALELYRDLGDSYNVADVLTHLGDAEEASGRSDAARAAWLEAVDIFDALRHPAADDVRAKL